jgi:predicted SAM-dependent methyltransferase
MRIIKRIIKRIIYIDIIFRFYEIISYLRFRNLIEKAKKNDNLRLHLGSGGRTLAGWINIDMQLKPEVLAMKLPRGLKRFDDNSVRYIYTSHFLEHLEYPAEASDFVRQCHRILTSDGGLRIVVPGIEKIMRAYVRDDRDFFKIQAEMHPSWCTTKFEHLMYALQQDGEHKYGYDFETMEKLLSQVGFRKVIRSDYNKSQIEGLRLDYRAKMDEAGEYLSLYVDAIK